MMTPEQFNRLANLGYQRIPLYKIITPQSSDPLAYYLQHAFQPYTYLFESVLGRKKASRYSIVGLPAKRQLKISGQQISIYQKEQLLETHNCDNPLDWLDNYLKLRRAPNDILPLRFSGGLVGYFAYDTLRYDEPRLQGKAPPDQLHIPDIMLMESDNVLVFDRQENQLYIIVNADPQVPDAFTNAQEQLDKFQEQLSAPLKNQAELTVSLTDMPLPKNVHSSIEREDYIKIVEQIKQYITAGDAMQVVPSRRISMPLNVPPILLYRALRHLNPSPYLYYVDFKECHLVGSSPEILLRCEEKKLTVCPIAGTRPRGKNEAEDLALEQELLSDPKEIAEHLMLIDLGRNDLGRVSRIGSVAADETFFVERYSHVMHIVSQVTGELAEPYSSLDALRVAIPDGTLSGAPKIRAMELIDEFEPVRRNFYGGALGYLAWNGNLDMAVTIRTALMKDATLYTQAGGGIVYDSVGENEWQETNHKAQAVLRAATMAEKMCADIQAQQGSNP